MLEKILFIGGDERLGSVQIRTVQMARHLGCDFTVNSRVTPELLDGKKLFVLTKAFGIDAQIHAQLQRQGKTISEIIDPCKIAAGVDGYIVSSATAKKALNLGSVPVFAIPQHHCNFANTPNPVRQRQAVAFIGANEWYPRGRLPPHTPFLDMSAGCEKVAEAYRRADILLNLRQQPAEKNAENYRAHLLLNGGIKLINCLGFGIPSISSDEPVYREFAPECTIFSTLKRCAADLRELQENAELYAQLRANCLVSAAQFSIEASARKYCAAFETLLD